MAGGYKKFGPTYNSTPHVRLGYEGLLNGTHEISAALVAASNADGTDVNGELAGKFASITADGVGLATAGGLDAVGLFREDLGDMVNASHKATFYFRGGEYYVNIHRTGLSTAADIAVGDEITTNAQGELVKKTATDGTQKALGVVTHVGQYRAGNMYEKATHGVTDTDTFIGFIMFV